MYKDVWKRVLAVMVTICLAVTLIEWPTTVKAEEGKTYHTYQYGGSESADVLKAETASAVFMTGQNASEGAEIFESVSFDVSIEDGVTEGNTKAVAELYTSPNPGDPGSGVFVCSNEIYSLVEGTNEISFSASAPRLVKGECFSVVITLEGEGVSFYTDKYGEAQRTFIRQRDGSWHDMADDGQSVTIKATTSDERMVPTEKKGILQRVAAVFSPNGDNEVTDSAASGSETADTLGWNAAEGGAGTGTAGAESTEGKNAGTENTGTESTERGTTGAESAGTESTEGGNAGAESMEGENAGTGSAEQEAADNNLKIESAGENGIASFGAARIAALELDQNNITIAVGSTGTLKVLNPDLSINYAWTSGDAAVASVTENGSPATSADITGVSEGNTVITVTAAEKDSGTVLGTAECPVSVKRSVGELTVSLGEAGPFVYDKTEKKPGVRVADGEKELTETVDFTVSYDNNVNASTTEAPAKVIITGQGGYAGKNGEVTFTIEPKDIGTVDNVAVEEIREGEDVAAKIVLTDLGATLGADDYTLRLDDNASAAGSHTAVAEGIGNYKGSKEIAYEVKRDISSAEVVMSEGNTFIYTGKEIHPAIDVKLDGLSLRQDEDYEINYTDCENVGTAKITITGEGGYFGLAAEQTFAILPKNISNEDETVSRVDVKPYPLPIAAKRDTLENSIPQFSMEYNGKELVFGTGTDADYIIESVEALDGTASNFATVTKARLHLKGQGNYTGKRQLDYNLGTDIGTAVESAVISVPSAAYTGGFITPEVTVTPKAGVSLTEGVDYKIEFMDNLNAGTAYVIVRGINSYGGVYSPDGSGYAGTFIINPADMSTLADSSFSYEKKVTYSPVNTELQPELNITYGGAELTNEDYSAVYEYPETSGVPEVGKRAQIVVTGAGRNFTGTKTLSYEILACPIDVSNIKVTMKRDYIYTGSIIKLEITLNYIDGSGISHELVENRDYEINISDAVSAGTKTVYIKGKTNYNGTRTETFSISKIQVNTLELEITPDENDVAGYGGPYRAMKKYADGRDVTLDIGLKYTSPDGTVHTLTETDDYELLYQNNKEMSKAGSTASVTIKGMGNYGGEMTIPFLIAKDLSGCEIGGVASHTTYTGDKITFQTLKVSDGGAILGNTLAKGEDFSTEYKNNENVTTDVLRASVTVKAVDDAKLPTQNGCYVGSQEKTFKIDPLDFSDISEENFGITVAKKYYSGSPVTLAPSDITAVYTTPSGAKKTLGTNDYSIMDTYNKNDQVTMDASVSIEGKNNFKGTKNIKFAIYGKSIRDLTITLEKEAWDYTGSAITPGVTVKDGSYNLVEGTDYEVAYSQNTNAGDAKVTITGMGSYADAVTKVFKILPLKLNENGNTTTLGGVESSYIYLPQGITPEPVVRFQKDGAAGTVTLRKDTDYKVTYQGNKNAGTNARVVVTGMGNYAGTAEQVFTITAKELTLNMVSDIKPQPFDGMYVCPPIEIFYEGYLLQASDYTVEYQNNFSVNDNAVAKITGKGNFSGSVEKIFRITNSINDSSITILCPDAGKTVQYTGSAVTPGVTVQSSITGNLVNGTDYEVTYQNNVNAGQENQAVIKVTGKGKYSGEKEFRFTISPKNLEESDVEAVFTDGKSSYEYTGSRITPEVIVRYNGNTLSSADASDYSVIYGENTGAGAGTVEIKATGRNYVGTRTLHFDITAKSIGSGTAFASGYSMDAIIAQGYTGSPICPTPGIHYRAGDGSVKDLVYGSDYTFEYNGNTEIGTAEITVVGTGNYAGSVKRTFEIRGSIEGAVVTVPSQAYEDWVSSGKVTPLPTVVLNGTALKKDKDYTVSYEDNDFVGEAKVIITGAGNYGGQISGKFDIIGDMERVTVEPIGDQAYTGSAITPIPKVSYYGHEIKGGGIDYTVSYNANTDIGEATVTLVGGDYFNGFTTVKFNIIPSTGNFVVKDIAPQKYCGSQIKPEGVTVKFGEATLSEGGDYKLTYGSNIDAGVGTVTVTGINSYKNIKPVTKTFTINPLDVNELVIKDTVDAGPAGGIAPREYTGAPILPEIKLLYQVDGATVYTLKSSDFEITCPAEDNVAVGTAHIVIGGKGNNVRGMRNEAFAITVKDINNTAVTISGGSNHTYTGLELKPEITIRNGLLTLTPEDYTVEYKKNVDAGTAEIHIQGVGSYDGSRVVKFNILRLSMNSSQIAFASVPDQVYTGAAVCPDVSVVYTNPNGEEVTLEKDVDYTLSYQQNTSVGSNAKAVITGRKNFTGSKTQSFAIGRHDIAAEDVLVAEIPNQAYNNGKPITPAVTVTCGEYTLKRGKDYEVTYMANSQIGTASVTIKGMNGYTGERTASFRIASGIENAAVTGLLESYPYTGAAVEPAGLVVKIGDVVLTPGTDYTVSFEHNTEVGTAALIINGAGELGGEKRFSFEITRKNIADSDVVLTGFKDSMAYTGLEVTQDITLTYGENVLDGSKDYNVQYTGNIEMGTAQMVITGDGNYTGTITKTFVITQNGAIDETIEIGNMSTTYTYTGEEIKPEPEIRAGGVLLTEGEDYTLSFENNTNAGVAKMVIQGINSYTGSQEVSFTVLRKSILMASFGTISIQTYTGQDIKPEVSVSDGGKGLSVQTDYDLMYAQNRRAGTGTAVVAGKGNYTATKVLRFDIRPGGVTSAAVVESTNSSVSLVWSGNGAVTGYEIFRAGEDGKYQRIARKKGTSFTDAQLTAGQTFYYKVRAYLVTDSDTYYSDFSPVVKGTT